MNQNVSIDNYNDSYNYIPEKMRRNFSSRGINAVRGYTAESLGCKSYETIVRDMREHIGRSNPNFFPTVRNAYVIAQRKRDEEKLVSLSAEKCGKKSVIERIVGLDKKPGEYSKREIIKKAEAAQQSINRTGEPERYVRSSHLPVSVFAAIIVCFIMMMFMIYGGVMVRGVMSDISDLESESASLAERERELSLELEVKNDLRVIEEIAVNDLGMIKKDFITKNYITMGNEDSIEVYAKGDANKPDSSSTLLSAIGRFMEYLN